ncbi:MAG: hypothetical protein IJ228_06345 [Succinivibrio sp.]|nr:hypothetical protein [Succinivibrio sp.]
MEITGGALADAVNNAMKNMGTSSDSIKSKLTEISSENFKGDRQMAMIQMNYEIGQYNAMLEATSNLSKSITDTLKSVAQKM